jgi:peptidoglycan/xylan/chitin deacetylase (PgdA/CDA1 family)
LHRLLEESDSGEILFALTFDDAWADNFESALPILQRQGATGCFFAATDAVSSGKLFWTEEVALDIGGALHGEGRRIFLDSFCRPGQNTSSITERQLLTLLMALIEKLKEFPDAERRVAIETIYQELRISPGDHRGRIMSWDQLRALATLGHIIGSHTKSHRILVGASAEAVDEEMLESRLLIEEQMGSKVDLFCFPNARFDRISASRVHANGYRYGFAMHNLPVSRQFNPQLVTRFSMCEKNSAAAVFKARFLKSWAARGLS